MKIVDLDTTIVSVPYRHQEVSSRVHRGGVTDVILKLTCDNGLVGWGESCSGADAASIEQAVLSAKPFVVGRDPWHSEAIARDFFGLGLWDYRAMTGNFAFAGIDQALWDLCGKDCGQPLYRLMGGPLRDEVDYFCYLAQGEPADLEQQCREAVDRGYSCFYLKVGIDADAEGEMLAAIRRTIGPDRKIRIDANEAWSVPEAARLINLWDDRHGIDFVEAPVPIDPVENMLELRSGVFAARKAFPDILSGIYSTEEIEQEPALPPEGGGRFSDETGSLSDSTKAVEPIPSLTSTQTDDDPGEVEEYAKARQTLELSDSLEELQSTWIAGQRSWNEDFDEQSMKILTAIKRSSKMPQTVPSGFVLIILTEKSTSQ